MRRLPTKGWAPGCRPFYPRARLARVRRRDPSFVSQAEGWARWYRIARLADRQIATAIRITDGLRCCR